MRIRTSILLSSWPLFLLLLIAAFAGCPSEQAGDEAARERWARRYLPFKKGWQPESTIPPKPQKKPGMSVWELSEYAPGTKPTPEQREAARELIRASERAARENGWFDYRKGLADGFTLMPNDRRHYHNEEYLFDDRILDPEHPEFLMYYTTPQGKKLMGLMFYARRAEERGPQVAGPLSVWHYHIWSRLNCLRDGIMLMGAPAKSDKCPQGATPTHRSPEMMHVWLVDHPQGRFATSMWLGLDLVQELVAKREAADAQRSAETR
jgi:hypothetical protein